MKTIYKVKAILSSKDNLKKPCIGYFTTEDKARECVADYIKDKWGNVEVIERKIIDKEVYEFGIHKAWIVVVMEDEGLWLKEFHNKFVIGKVYSLELIERVCESLVWHDAAGVLQSLTLDILMIDGETVSFENLDQSGEGFNDVGWKCVSN